MGLTQSSLVRVGCILMIALTYIVANLLTDFAYRLLDPRIKVE